jgi:hypothetical protein
MVDIKKGWHTSEFIISVAVAVSALATALGFGSAEPVIREIAIGIAGAVPIAYAILRTWLKRIAVLAPWFTEEGDDEDREFGPGDGA